MSLDKSVIFSSVLSLSLEHSTLWVSPGSNLSSYKTSWPYILVTSKKNRSTSRLELRKFVKSLGSSSVDGNMMVEYEMAIRRYSKK